MKNILLVLLCCASFIANAQDKSGIVTNAVLYIGPATNNETLTKQELLATDALVMKGGDTKWAVYSFTLAMKVNGSPVQLSSPDSRITQEMKDAFKKLSNGSQLEIRAKVQQPHGAIRLMRLDVTVGNVMRNTFNFKAKLLKGAEKLEALVNQEVVLKDEAGKAFKTAITDQYGDFEFSEVPSDKQYELQLTASASISDEPVFLARPNGTIISKLSKNAEGTFAYKLLPKEHIQLELMEAEDPSVKVADLTSGKKTEITITENIHYPVASSAITAEAATKLDKVISVLQNDPSITLQLVAHTDSRGDEAANLTLSEARAKAAVQYMIKKGIAKERVSGSGMGEGQLLNRCADNVSCSEQEHQANRRTEFRFIKKK